MLRVSVSNWSTTVDDVASSLAALHRWLFTEHRAYAAGADPRSDAPPAAALDS